MVNKQLKYHLMPKKGWLNDPNGLVYFKGRYHIFYQADEDSLDGHINKSWGHYSTQNFNTYIRHDLAIVPDSPDDKNGAYSGSAVIKNDVLYLFYTGNVKYEGDYDYVLRGREHNLMRVESTDGIHFVNKKCLLKNEDYPKDCTKHVRDPKLFKKGDLYHLVLGARLKDNTSCVLEYVSTDLEKWKYLDRYIPNEKMGFMIECPDYVDVGNQAFMFCSPQGLNTEHDLNRNIYESGFYMIKNHRLVDYARLDYGFDFYAPQTFYNTDRTIMIGWVGMPDNSYVDCVGEWNQALTLPRKITKGKKIKQFPIQEILNLRSNKTIHNDSFSISKSSNLEFHAQQSFIIRLNNVVLLYENSKLCLDLTRCNCQRNYRYIDNITVDTISLFVDETVLEIFINDGEYTMTTRFYDDEPSLNINFEGIEEIVSYEMRGFKIQ